MTTAVDFGAPLSLAPAATAGRRPCAVCGLPYLRALDAAHHLCPYCAEDLPKARALAEDGLAQLEARITAHHGAWSARQAGLDDALAARWTRLVQDRATAEGRVVALERGTIGRNVVAEREQLLAAARERLAQVAARIARTAAEPGHPLAGLIAEDAAFHAELTRLLGEQGRWVTALQEIDVAAGVLPF